MNTLLFSVIQDYQRENNILTSSPPSNDMLALMAYELILELRAKLQQLKAELAHHKEDAELWKQSEGVCNEQYNLLLKEKRQLEAELAAAKHNEYEALVEADAEETPVRGEVT